MPAVDRPEPAEYQPAISVWGHCWRFVACLAISAFAWFPIVDDQSEAVWLLDVGLGIAVYVLVFWGRRRHPLLVGVVANLLGAGSAIAAGPAVLATVSLATRRRWREVALVGSIGFAAAQFLTSWQPGQGAEPVWIILIANATATLGLLAWGMYIGSRRELLWTLRHRAESAEAERDLRVAQARSTERAAIAREMHDVLAHRITQISLHAGAITYREDLGPTEVRASLQVVQEKAHEALADLRHVLGVLREGDDDAVTASERPQPTLAALPALVDEVQDGGTRVQLETHLAGEPGEASARTAYRVVQEGLTNAAKHAPDATVSVTVTGSPEDGLTVEVANPLGFARPVRTGTRPPVSGLGLIGLAERAALRGGRLEHGVRGGRFVLWAWLPW